VHKRKSQVPLPKPPIQQHDAEGSEEYMCETKWQLYYHGAETRGRAAQLLGEGLGISIG
jgi:hypothetical protein